MEWVTTITILQQLGDPAHQDVWDRFCSRFRDPLIGFARRYGLSAEEAEDVSQEIFIAFAESYRAGKYATSKGRLSSWLFGIAQNVIANFRRKRMRESKKRDERGGHTSFWGELPEKAEQSKTWDAEWEQAALEHGLTQARSEVAERTYRAFELVVRKGRSPEEAAAELGMTREAVYVAKHRVLKRLGDLMKDFDAADL